MTLTHQRLRAPQENGKSLQVPPLADWQETLLHNQALLGGYAFELSGNSISSLQREAQQELLQLAVAYSSQYRDISLKSSIDTIVMGGHQPTLFHPGVWYKNFVLSRFALQANAVAVNLVVDNDFNPLRSIRVPAGSVAEPRIETIHYDSLSARGPFETEELHSPDTFKNFAQSVSRNIKPFVSEPLVHRLWPHAVASLGRMGQPSLALAAGRHRFEQDLGLQTLELPVSQICKTRAFAIFAAELFERSAEFRAVHNEQLVRYRQVNRIRSQSHPVPELRKLDDWVELPFWIWRTGSTSRNPLFVKQEQSTIYVSDQKDVLLSLDRRASLAEQIHLWEAEGICLRTRALTTTMYSRLVLCDLFLHGIGGGKYDQLTDEIIRKFFAVEPPGFSVVTSTHHLPIDFPRVTESDLARVRNRLRDLKYHAEHFGDFGNESFQAEAERKVEHWRAIPDAGSKKVWHDEMERINEQLRLATNSDRIELETEIESLRRMVRVTQLLGSREFSFCLFDEVLIAQLNA